VTAVEAHELITRGGATDFTRLIEACEAFGPYCLIGGLAVNTYLEPLYTVEADLVAIASSLPDLSGRLTQQGFKVAVTSPNFHRILTAVFCSVIGLLRRAAPDPTILNE
jgi:hypothetical protein